MVFEDPLGTLSKKKNGWGLRGKIWAKFDRHCEKSRKSSIINKFSHILHR